MSTETLDVEFTAPEVGTKLALFQPTDAAIAEMAQRYMPLAIRDLDDAEGFKAVHAARMTVKACRVQVEKTRKALKADALEYGRRVDGEAARITAALDPIETHLETQEKRITDERERIKREAERLEAMRPDVEKIRAMGAVLRSIQWPTVTSSRAIMHVAQAQAVIEALAIRCEGFSA